MYVVWVEVGNVRRGGKQGTTRPMQAEGEGGVCLLVGLACHEVSSTTSLSSLSSFSSCRE